METPPPAPASEPRKLGWLFVVVLLAPLALFANSLSSGVLFPLTDEAGAAAAAISAPVCALICAFMVARSGPSTKPRFGLGVLTFFGATALYAAAAFAGCVVNFSNHMGISPP